MSSSPSARMMQKIDDAGDGVHQDQAGAGLVDGAPAPRKRPVPIAPPIAIIWICRLPRPRA